MEWVLQGAQLSESKTISWSEAGCEKNQTVLNDKVLEQWSFSYHKPENEL